SAARSPRLNRGRVSAGIIDCLGILPTGLSAEELRLLDCLIVVSDGSLGQVCSTRRGTGLQKWLSASGDIPIIAGRDIAPFEPPRPGAFVHETAVEPARLRWIEP